MSLPILHSHSGPRPYPDQPLPGGFGLGLQRARVHEICGPARVTLAAMILELSQGPVLWIAPSWSALTPYAPGLAGYANPARVIFAHAHRPEDLLWSLEEALRSGAVPLVVAELLQPPGLTPIRRLHLAAESGASAARHRGGLPPLALLLTPGMGGAQGVESRWHLEAQPSGTTLTQNRGAWALTRLRARMAPPATWALTRSEGAPRL